MIYECAVITKTQCTEQDLESIQTMVRNVLQETSENGEVLVQDDWGKKSFAQPTSQGIEAGHYLYFIFRGSSQTNTEVIRRLRINEGVLKFLILSLGKDGDQESLVKRYKTPFSKRYHGSVTDQSEEQQSEGGSRKRFVKRRSCWFSTNNITADWKDPATYAWLVSEFGKITPARISGISRKHQRFSTQAIKRARQLGIVSHVSNRIVD